MSLPNSQLECTKDYRKYADTVAILAAIYNLFQRQPNIARYVGIETRLVKDQKEYKTPDLVALYGEDTKGLIFEIKWSLPLDIDLLEREIKELRKYADSFTNWKNTTGRVEYQDMVLVCHMDDVKRTVDMIKRVSEQPNCNFLKDNGFAVWSWTITPAKLGERKEELRLFRCYGKTRNKVIEDLLDEPGGILISEDVLTYLRFNFFFVRQKPPIQYTMTTLILHIFIASQPGIEQVSYEVNTDWIYTHSRIFFPSWHEYDEDTVQLKKRWIREALDFFWHLKLIEKTDRPDRWKIPIPILRSRQPAQQALCKRIVKWQIDQSKRRPRAVKIKPIRAPKRKKGPLDEFMQ